jgi:2-keto-4-pentenoate hydratase
LTVPAEPTAEPWDDPRVAAATPRLLERRASEIDGGARPIGWKLAFGARPALENLGLSAPLVGYLTDATVIESGSRVSIGDWPNPTLEAEIAIFVGEALPAGSTPEACEAAITAVGPAIELAAVDPPPSADGLEEVIAGDIYHRGVVLPPEPMRRPGAEVGDTSMLVMRDGEEVALAEDPEAAVGALPELVAHVAAYLGAFGASLEPGDVIISGSTVPLVGVAPGQILRVQLEPLGTLEVELTA